MTIIGKKLVLADYEEDGLMSYYNAIRLLIYCTPFIDGLNGLAMTLGLPVVFGQIIRIPIIAFILYLLANINFKIFSLAFSLFSLSIIRDVFLSDYIMSDIAVSVTVTLRYFYVLFFLLLVNCSCKRKFVTIVDLLTWCKKTILIFAVIILLSKVSGFGLTYAGASKGLFIEVNALTALLVWGASIWIYPLYFSSPDRYDLLGALFVIVATASQATKTGLIGIIVILLYYGVVNVVVQKNIKILIGTVLFIIISGLIIYTYLMSEIGSEILSRWKFFLEKMDLFTFLMSGRNIALQAAFSEWADNILYILFGTGFSGGEKLTLGQNPILSYGGPEMDIFDIGFFYGIFAMLIVTYYLLKPVIMNKYHRNNIVNVKFSYLLFLVVMFLGGHVLSSPMAGIFFTVAYVANKYYD